MVKPPRIAVFLDRDGTINEDPNGYVFKINDFKFISGSDYAIRRLNKLDLTVVIVTNQSGIDRGLYKIEDVDNLHNYMMDKLFEMGAKIDAIYYCPHLKSSYRKPNDGMFKQAIEDLELYNYRYYVVGDKTTDIEAGAKVGCKKILVLTGEGMKSLEECNSKNIELDYVAKDLLDASKYIEQDIINNKYI